MEIAFLLGESIPIRLFLAGYDPTPTMRDVNKKFSVRYFLNLVLVDEEDRRYFKQQVWCHPAGILFFGSSKNTWEAFTFVSFTKQMGVCF